MAGPWSEFCIYTIKKPEALKTDSEDPVDLSEKHRWVTGYDLWNKAKEDGLLMPIVFGDATDCKRLFCWGILTRVDPPGEITNFRVSGLTPIRGRPQSLTLRSTRQHIAALFIRPYAICYTPKFIREAKIESLGRHMINC